MFRTHAMSRIASPAGRSSYCNTLPLGKVYLLFRYFYDMTQWAIKRTNQQTITCCKFSFVFWKRLFFKGLSHSGIVFEYELFTGFSLTAMHSLDIRFQLWNQRCGASVAVARTVTWMTILCFIKYFGCVELLSSLPSCCLLCVDACDLTVCGISSRWISSYLCIASFREQQRMWLTSSSSNSSGLSSAKGKVR